MAYKHDFPIVWVIGGTRSCKTAIAENGVGPLGFRLISTGNYFRARYAKPDTWDRAFVFNLSAYAADCLAEDPACHIAYLEKLLADANGPCVIEGERNPMEFAHLYHPRRDMVVFVNRLDVDKYDTVIERGLAAIENHVRWCVGTGVAPRESVIKVTFGDLEIKGEYFGRGYDADETFIKGAVKARNVDGDVEDRYPWINILIGLVRERIEIHYGKADFKGAEHKALTAPKPAI